MARIDAPGLTHHVTVRGIEQRVIFRDDRDREAFVDRLAELVFETLVTCFAWALMPNHVHLVVRTGSVPLARLMARLNTGYASYFNRRHDRVGHLFQNRYRSIPVLDDAYLRTLLRYVHRNPLRAALVSDLQSLDVYPWTGHAALMGSRPARFEDVPEVLRWFGERPDMARSRLRAWMSDADDADGFLDPLLEGGLPAVVRWAAVRCGVAERDITGGARHRSVVAARAIVAHVACDLLGMRQSQLAEALGLSEAAVHNARRRGSGLVRFLMPQ
jgi:REP element-mobilizing transposase RayT